LNAEKRGYNMSKKRKLKNNFAGSSPKEMDLVFMDGRQISNIGGNLIRFLESGGRHPKNKFFPNHCGIIIEANNDIHKCKVIQAGLRKVEIKELSIWSKNTKINVVIKRCTRPELEQRKRQLKHWLKNQVGKKYDYLAIVWMTLRAIVLYCIIKNKFLRWLLMPIKNIFSSKERFTCSELIGRAFQEIVGIKMYYNIHYTNLTPNNEYMSKKFRTIKRIYNFQYEEEEELK